MKIISVVGARPNFIKVAPVIRAVDKHNKSVHSSCLTRHVLVHTGQHYNHEMSEVFFEDLELPEPDIYLGVGSGSHAEQTGRILVEFEKVLLTEKPDIVMVVGDVNSTLAAALAAAKLRIPVAHVEAGLRSYDRRMPEETNRVLTDHISSFLICPTKTAVKNLQKEGFTNVVNQGELVTDCTSLSTFHLPHLSSQVPSSTSDISPLVINVGDVMYESALYYLKIAKRKSKILQALNLTPASYILATVHRAENTDNVESLKEIFDSFVELSKNGEKLIIPLHPRTQKALAQISINLIDYLRSDGLEVIKPISYLDMLILESNARMIVTDSGGVQKEAYFFKVPCLTLRDETEWVETVESGWNVLSGANKEKIVDAIEHFEPRGTQQKYFGEGKTAERIVKIIVDKTG